ncbi:MAG: carbohydrate porin [Deltaproteobacteria bacterium]|nr:carbohydrate porin [Deltaproteobacteria bacterium]
MTERTRASSPPIRAARLLCALGLLAASAPAAADFPQSFEFGSYGRVGAGYDLRGAPGGQTNVVTHGPRLEESPYAELEMRSLLGRPTEARVRIVATLALNGELFHYTGDFQSRIGVRNLYAEAQDVFVPGLFLWAGSRMYRGDDLYLLDYWPLDNLNTMGGGAIYLRGRVEGALQVGLNRLTDPYQFQLVPTPAPTFGSREYAYLDRVRTVASARALFYVRPDAPGLRLKVKLYAEVQQLPAGKYLNETDHTEEPLPSDYGWVVGAQLGAWNFGRNSHANLFVRFGGGLGAYDTMAIPSGFDVTRHVTAARDVVLAFSGNYERRRLGLQVAAYLRSFHEANDIPYNPNNFLEGVIDLRPYVFVGKYFRQAFDLSWQRRSPAGFNPETGTHEAPQVFKLGVMPTVALFGGGTYDRPEFRIIYSASFRNQGARLLFAADDPHRLRRVEHYLGLGVEWWFNSSYR